MMQPNVLTARSPPIQCYATYQHRSFARRHVRAQATLDSRWLKGMQFINPAFTNVHDEEGFFNVLKDEVAAGRCPKQLVPLWQDFYQSYKTAIIGSGEEGANDKLVAQVQSSIADCTLDQLANPYTFPSLHNRILSPYNYYEFGQRYVGSLTNFKDSVLGHPDRWNQVDAWLQQGHNVVLLANHQTEADPGVFAHMLAHSNPRLAENVIYVAGDRVVTDPLCKPFSMGRNLFCVHSKKHMKDVPELEAQKRETNRRTLIAMQRKFNEGGTLVWIAPSGGRDRPKDGTWLPAEFDPSAVDLMRNLITRAKQPGHLIPMAMYSWPLMPPPPQLEKAVGERRVVNFTPVGISLCEELDIGRITSSSSLDTEEKKQGALANKAWQAVVAEYQELENAIKNPQLRGNVFVQPWVKEPVLV